MMSCRLTTGNVLKDVWGGEDPKFQSDYNKDDFDSELCRTYWFRPTGQLCTSEVMTGERNMTEQGGVMTNDWVSAWQRRWHHSVWYETCTTSYKTEITRVEAQPGALTSLPGSYKVSQLPSLRNSCCRWQTPAGSWLSDLKERWCYSVCSVNLKHLPSRVTALRHEHQRLQNNVRRLVSEGRLGKQPHLHFAFICSGLYGASLCCVTCFI